MQWKKKYIRRITDTQTPSRFNEGNPKPSITAAANDVQSYEWLVIIVETQSWLCEAYR
jgi:hypothetical protein